MPSRSACGVRDDRNGLFLKFGEAITNDFGVRTTKFMTLLAAFFEERQRALQIAVNSLPIRVKSPKICAAAGLAAVAGLFIGGVGAGVILRDAEAFIVKNSKISAAEGIAAVAALFIEGVGAGVILRDAAALTVKKSKTCASGGTSAVAGLLKEVCSLRIIFRRGDTAIVRKTCEEGRCAVFGGELFKPVQGHPLIEKRLDLGCEII